MHGFGWMKAHRLAEALNLPLHCIVHDDWPSMYGGRGDSYVRRRFEESYVAARSRLCVSAAMVEEYKNRYGCAGEVLLPCRSPGVTGSLPQGIRKNKAGPITMAFAGSINGQGYAHALRHVADCLAEQDGKLLIYGPLTETAAANAGLQMPNVKICGMIDPARLVETLQREADLLFVPMSFDQIDRTNMTIAFPSKLTDYTLTGLPLLIYGPEYCSAVRFARENHGLAEVVATTDPTEMKQTLRRLTDPVQRASLGESSITLGNRLFSLESALKIFYAGL